jgi:hypothetical protein
MDIEITSRADIAAMDKGIRNMEPYQEFMLEDIDTQAEGHSSRSMIRNDMTGPFSARLHRLSRSTSAPTRQNKLGRLSWSNAAQPLQIDGINQIPMVTTERPQHSAKPSSAGYPGAMQHRMLADQTVTTENL